MTDTLPAQAPVTPNVASPADNQIQSLANDIATTLRAAPELKTARTAALNQVVMTASEEWREQILSTPSSLGVEIQALSPLWSNRYFST
jgi:hypothetical protein